MEIIQPLPYQAYKCIFNILRLLPKCLICKHFLVLCHHFCLLEKPLMLLAKRNSDFCKQQNIRRECSHSWCQQFSTLAYPSYHPHKPTPADGPTLQISRTILLTFSQSCSKWYHGLLGATSERGCPTKRPRTKHTLTMCWTCSWHSWPWPASHRWPGEGSEPAKNHAAVWLRRQSWAPARRSRGKHSCHPWSPGCFWWPWRWERQWLEAPLAPSLMHPSHGTTELQKISLSPNSQHFRTHCLDKTWTIGDIHKVIPTYQFQRVCGLLSYSFKDIT